MDVYGSVKGPHLYGSVKGPHFASKNRSYYQRYVLMRCHGATEALSILSLAVHSAKHETLWE